MSKSNTLQIVLFLISCFFIISCTRSTKMAKENEKAGLPMFSNWDVKYPVDLSSEQKNALYRLTSLNLDFTSQDKEFNNLVAQLKKLALPPLAALTDLEITENHFKNVSNNDVLIIVEHNTGRDIAVRTHWLKKGQHIERSYMGTRLVYPVSNE